MPIASCEVIGKEYGDGNRPLARRDPAAWLLQIQHRGLCSCAVWLFVQRVSLFDPEETRTWRGMREWLGGRSTTGMCGRLNVTEFDRVRFEVSEDPGYLGTANGNVVYDNV